MNKTETHRKKKPRASSVLVRSSVIFFQRNLLVLQLILLRAWRFGAAWDTEKKRSIDDSFSSLPYSSFDSVMVSCISMPFLAKLASTDS